MSRSYVDTLEFTLRQLIKRLTDEQKCEIIARYGRTADKQEYARQLINKVGPGRPIRR
jgi:hypothetical protein